MTEEESEPLLEFLYRHQVRPEYTLPRGRWGRSPSGQPRTLHNPINDYQGFRRRMHRVTLAGDRPR
jgi:taurine dioxygenase